MPVEPEFAMATAPGGDDVDEMSAADLKAALLDSLYGTERGLAARSEVRAEINELITQLEAKNPTPSPTEVRLPPGPVAHRTLPSSLPHACTHTHTCARARVCMTHARTQLLPPWQNPPTTLAMHTDACAAGWHMAPGIHQQ